MVFNVYCPGYGQCNNNNYFPQPKHRTLEKEGLASDLRNCREMTEREKNRERERGVINWFELVPPFSAGGQLEKVTDETST